MSKEKFPSLIAEFLEASFTAAHSKGAGLVPFSRDHALEKLAPTGQVSSVPAKDTSNHAGDGPDNSIKRESAPTHHLHQLWDADPNDTSTPNDSHCDILCWNTLGSEQQANSRTAQQLENQSGR